MTIEVKIKVHADIIEFNGFSIGYHADVELWHVVNIGFGHVDSFRFLEQALEYCNDH